MKLRFAGFTDQGLVRPANQDSFCLDDPQGRFFIVADGMGGHAGGEEASRIATFTIQDYLDKHWSEQLEPDILLVEAFRRANENILQTQKVSPERVEMGTTAVVVIFPEHQVPWCAHVGDSRLYRFRQAQLQQITEDHTWVAQAVRAGILTTDQARLHPWRHVLAQCLGRVDLSHIEVQPLDIQSGDMLLLCSDGLTEEVPDGAIASHLSTAHSCEEMAANLIEEAKLNGGQDNITVVLITVDTEPNPDAVDLTAPDLGFLEISDEDTVLNPEEEPLSDEQTGASHFGNNSLAIE